jgi:hypothetical protein
MARSPFRLLFAALALAAVLPGCDIKVDDKGELSVDVSHGRASDEWVRSYTLAKGGRFEIANQNGEIVVKGTTGAEVKVTAHRQVNASSDAQAQDRLKNIKMREEVTADRVFIEAQSGNEEGFGGFQRGLGIRWEVEVPAGLTLSVKTTNGTVRLDGVDGRITAATTNGNVSGSASGSVQGSAVNGSVALSLASVTGDVQLRTVNGAIRLTLPPTADADLDATTVNGGVSVDERLVLADVSSNRSNFGPMTSIRGRLNKGGARVTLQTTNGGVRVTTPGSGEDGDDVRGPELRGRRGRGDRPDRTF